MEELLKLNPEYTRDAKLIKKIGRKIVFKDSQSLKSCLSIISLPLFKILLRKSFYDSDELKKTYKEIIRKESNGVERMIFEILCGKTIKFKDIMLKFQFYKEFPEQRSLFIDDKAGIAFQIEDLLFRKVYFHEDTTESIEKLLYDASSVDRIFFILALKPFLFTSFISGLVFEIIREIAGAEQKSYLSKYLPIALKSLQKRDLYAFVTSEMLFSPLVEKMRIFTAVQDAINHETLSLCMLNESWNANGPVVRIYIVFLKMIEMLRLSYDFRVKLLYSWMRYFLYQGHLDMFYDLFDSMKKAKGKTEEFVFYTAMNDYLKTNEGFEKVLEASFVIKDDNQFPSISIDDIIEKYKPQDDKSK